MLKYMLDTNIIIYTLKNRPAQVRTMFKQHEGQMCISTVTLGELVFGAENSQQIERNLADIESMISRLEVLPFDNKAAQHFGQIRADLYRKGQPIGPYDMMIAGHARACGLQLVSNNVKEFSRIPGLILENWATATPDSAT
ncbi:tRNA(fMet)-specific endonuclease VapC [Desulfuromonas carbonis]|uniref:type II toxin-antitoxin system tRNA(fMet)-specific endonuclease VapC n=1 Tax=Desulfuromonas sp. DDH964 TaxID=1823759 RepID=UPI00078CFF08|nr:tRNA(fMet)-specific endonuclease VapC [Desulfuromonas sp. DDH964]AMV73351.1 toxin, PIN family [Desulfuromonas sp. DDH964]